MVGLVERYWLRQARAQTIATGRLTKRRCGKELLHQPISPITRRARGFQWLELPKQFRRAELPDRFQTYRTDFSFIVPFCYSFVLLVQQQLAVVP